MVDVVFFYTPAAETNVQSKMPHVVILAARNRSQLYNPKACKMEEVY